jgi:hypothetical protein
MPKGKIMGHINFFKLLYELSPGAGMSGCAATAVVRQIVVIQLIMRLRMN